MGDSVRFAAGDTVAGRYRVARLIGRGGMGDVYAAEHLLTGQQVALKVVRRAGDEGNRRLLREAKAASRLKSRHTARVLDADTLPSGDPFLVLELLSGQDLASVLQARGRLSAACAVSYVAQAAEALAEAHALGIIHRDVKPANLFLVDEGDDAQVKVLDFGIAKLDAGSDTSVTITGSVMGSPRYMSPEQIRDPKRVDARTDVWALGVTLHELLTGHAPFEGNYAPALCAMITSDAPRLRIAELPSAAPELLRIVERCLAKDPAQRFASASALQAELRSVVLDEAGQQAPLARVARAHADDTLEPQDTSRRGDLLHVAASPSPAAAALHRRKPFAVALGALGLGLVALWARHEASVTESAGEVSTPEPPAAAATAVSAVEAWAQSAEIEPPPSSLAPPRPAPEHAGPSASAAAALASVATPKPPLRRAGSARALPTAESSVRTPIDESAVLQDRR